MINVILFDYSPEQVEYKEKLRYHYNHEKLKYDIDEIYLGKRYIIVSDARQRIIVLYKDKKFIENPPVLFLKNKVITYVNYSYDERFIIVGDASGAFSIWNLETYMKEFENTPNKLILNKIFAQDNSQLLSYCKRG